MLRGQAQYDAENMIGYLHGGHMRVKAQRMHDSVAMCAGALGLCYRGGGFRDCHIPFFTVGKVARESE